MPEPSFLGLSKPHWDLINGFANWFAAAGSIAAAAVALYIANRAARPSAEVSVGHRVIFGPGSTEPHPQYVVFHIVNTGDRPIRIKQIGWKVGFFRKQFAVQQFDQTSSSTLPADLTHGQEASWYVPLAAQEQSWPEQFAKKMLFPHFRSALWTLRGQFFTSVGYIFEARPEKNLVKRLRSACKQVSTNDKYLRSESCLDLMVHSSAHSLS